MKKLQLILIIFCVSFFQVVKSQTIEIGGGANFNKFFNYTKSEYNPTYGSGFGWNASIAFSDIPITDYYRPKVELSVLNYRGYLKTQNFGFTYSSSHEANVYNTNLSLTIFPLALHVFKSKLNLHSGLTISYLVHSRVTGTVKRSDYFAGTYHESNMDPKLAEPIILAFSNQINYKFNIGEKFQLVPTISFHLGVTKDYDFEQAVRKMNFSFEFRLARNL